MSVSVAKKEKGAKLRSSGDDRNCVCVCVCVREGRLVMNHFRASSSSSRKYTHPHNPTCINNNNNM